MCGVEYFAHPWEFGARKTKELMLTGDSIDADEAYRLGMVSKIFPVDELGDRTLEFARRIAKLPTMTALLIKESVNQTAGQPGLLQLAATRASPCTSSTTRTGRSCTTTSMAVAKVGEDVPEWRGTKLKVAERDTVEAV